MNSNVNSVFFVQPELILSLLILAMKETIHVIDLDLIVKAVDVAEAALAASSLQ